ncbi:MAG TPA: integrin [Gammaproteobacteria bacterium]|nr:integrin [Gammaproteobacteria bacterium]
MLKIKRYRTVTLLVFLATLVVGCNSDSSVGAPAPGSPPVANAGPDQNVATGSSVTLAGGGSTDADGNPLTYSWSFTSRPAGSTAALSSTTAVNPTFTADVDGAYVISLVVNDGTVDSAADSVTVTASTSAGAPLAAATPALAFTSVKIFQFTWTDVSDATFYQLLENPDGVSGFTQVGSDITQGVQSVDHVVPLYARVNASYILRSCNGSGCIDSAAVLVSGTLVGSIGYVKASNSGGGDKFGYSVSLAADGNTLAVGANNEDSNATGINGDQADNTATKSGAVYVFSRSGTTWTQQAYLKASNTEANDRFGGVVSLAADGNTLAVGALREASSATGINGDQADNLASESGAVYVFSRSGTTWSQQAYVKASNTEANDRFSWTVSLAADGNTLAVGAYAEDSSATGIDGDQTNNLASSSGVVYVFSRSGAAWSQQAYVKASNTGLGDQFGVSVSLAADGNTLAVGATGEASNATGINGDQANNTASSSGAVYVFSRSGAAWSQQAYVKASNTGGGDVFGASVNLAADGSTLAVGAASEASSDTGINGDQADNSASDSGAVYVFSRSGAAWSQQAYVKASNTGGGDVFGRIVSLAADGNTLAVGASSEASSATGINGNQVDDSVSFSGAVYVFSRSGTTWSQQAYVKAGNTGGLDGFGWTLNLTADGNTLAVGAAFESSNATGINGNQADNSASGSGAVYLY